MQRLRRIFTHAGLAALLMGLVIGMAPMATLAAAAPSADIREAQTIITKFGIPVGPIDGLHGPNTAQGLCAFRWIAGMKASRAPLDSATLATLRDYNTRYASGHKTPKKHLSNGASTYLVVEQTCQTMFVFLEGTWWATFPVSTGRAGLDTPNGYYKLSGIPQGWRGWTCSTVYTQSCRNQTAGKDIAYGNYGNMYNKRQFTVINGVNVYIHGSNTVPTRPDSAGCVRVSVQNMDWISSNVPANTGLLVTGKYVASSTDRASAGTTTRSLK